MPSTQELFNIALDLAGLEKPTADAAVIVPGENIRKVLVGISMNTPEVIIGKLMGYDLVCSHHPRNIDLPGMDKLFCEQMYTMHAAGVPLNHAQKIIEKPYKIMAVEDTNLNYDRNATAAEVLGMPFMCIHTPADILVERGLQKMFDERFGDKPETPLSELLKALEGIPEYDNAIYKPEIAAGSPDTPCGKIKVIMTGVTEGGPESTKSYFRAGIGTLVYMHCSRGDIEVASEPDGGNIINAGHMASDSYGMNRILEKWEALGVEVTRVSGLIGGAK